jgi:hypothetical protein
MDIGMLWHDELLPLVEPEILGIPWRKLPIYTRQRWWKETDYRRRSPSPEFVAQLPQLLAIDQAKVDEDKRELAAELAAGHEMLKRATPATPTPCDHCLRRMLQTLLSAAEGHLVVQPTSLCKVRCLRSMLEEVASAK